MPAAAALTVLTPCSAQPASKTLVCACPLQSPQLVVCNSLRTRKAHLHRAQHQQRFQTCATILYKPPVFIDAGYSDSDDDSTDEDDDDYSFLYELIRGEMSDNGNRKVRVGEKIMATVSEVSQRGATVEVRGKVAAVCPSEECTMSGKVKANMFLRPGERREFVVIKDEFVGGPGLRLSLRKPQEELCWLRVKQIQEEEATVDGEVVQVNKGGLMLEVEHLRGFVPVSQVPKTETETLDEWVGRKLAVKIIEADQGNDRLVFSARKAAGEKQLRAFNIGDVAEGVVQSVKPYGAFIDLGGGMNGLLHISQISFDRIGNVGAILSEGDKIKVMILSQDMDRGRMSLSTKKLEPLPGDMIKNPQKVYDEADEMAAQFRDRLAAAEAQVRQQGMQF